MTCLVPVSGLERKVYMVTSPESMPFLRAERSRFGIIGAGRVGAVLGARLAAAGHCVHAASARSAASRLRVETLLPEVAITEPADIAATCDVVFLAVPDDELIAVCEALANIAQPGQIYCHTSGRHGLDALTAITRTGARAIAMHPAMTFTGTTVDVDRSCVFGLTAEDADRKFAERLVADLGGTTMWVADSDRSLYHTAMAHGANHLVTLVSQAMDLLRTAGAADPSAVLRPLLTAALDNTLAYGDAALTGPVARGDITTLRAHADALASAAIDDDIDDDTVATYLAMARATSHRAEDAGSISADTAHEVRDVLQEADWNTMAGIIEELQ